MATVEKVEVFTDGACSGNGKKGSKSGCGVYIPLFDIEISMTSNDAFAQCGINLSKESNNVGELLAILVAMLTIEDKAGTDLVIYSDSMYCISSLSVWHKGWERNNWKTAKGSPVKNQEIIKKIIETKKQFHGVFFSHINSHTQEPSDTRSQEWWLWNGNDTADKLACKSIF
jgi:ribonuclease HI